ncbi:glycosyltransferase family 25 protein [Nitratireductor sp. GCM10026969]|uniref:glycosyltransferase family 25 protein n=1 Tax=Nitratireductor sp. GCM10026969 TaxID=3252645 RepID=UPI00361AD18B
MKTEAFIIHLKRAHGRAPQVARLKATLPMPATVVDAVDGQALSEAQIARVYCPALHRPRYPFALRLSETACFLSHRKAWREIVDRELDAGLIVEDDVELGDGFSAVLDLALSRLDRGEIVRFPKKARGERGKLVARAAAACIVAPRPPRLGMQAQLVGRDAARALLAFTERFDRPVDTTIQMQWLHGLPVLTAMPVAIREVAGELGGTTVQGKSKPIPEILARELHRARYRFAVRLCNVLNSPPEATASREN